MKFNAFNVCNELTCRIDGAPTLNGFLKSLGQKLEVPNIEYLKKFITAAPTKSF